MMDDDNSYPLLVRVLKTQAITEVENIETPFEHLAQLNNCKVIVCIMIMAFFKEHKLY